MSKIIGTIHIEEKYNTIIPKYDFFEISNSLTEGSYGLDIYVGFFWIRNKFGEQIITSNKINKNTFWTFSPEERLQDFNEELPKIVFTTIKKYIKSYKYKFIDPLVDNLYKSEDIINYIENIVSFNKNERLLYFLNEVDHIIYGLDINYMRELGIDIKKFAKLFKTKFNLNLKNITEINDNLEIPPKYRILNLN